MSRSSQAGDGAGNGGGGAGNGGNDPPSDPSWRDLVPFVLVLALAVVTAASVVFSYCAFNQLLMYEERVKMEIRPVHLLLHFRNAQLSEPNGGLSGSGVDLEPLHKRMLDATVNTLRECADQENPVRIRPYGFASSKPFAGRDDTNDLNVMAANRRARAVYKALKERLPDGSLVNVEEPPRWDTFAAMVKERDACIESPSGERGRDPFFDRVVVLDLQTPGRCAPADWAARTIRCSGSEGAGP